MIALDVRGGAAGYAPAARAKLVARLARAMRAAGLEGEVELSLSLVDDAEIQALNHEWRGEDKPTDVLSFSLVEGSSFPPVAGPPTLGDVVISVETAARQAEGRGVTLDEELLHLAVHGLAHLCGYDHADVDEERVMFGWETKLREQAVGRGPVVVVPRPLL